MDDQELNVIERLSEGGLKPAALSKYLKDKRVAANQIAPGEDGSYADVTRHVLLQDAVPGTFMYRRGEMAPAFWRAIAGSGALYNGAFGPLDAHGRASMLKEAGLTEVVFTQDAAPAPAAHRTNLCVNWAASGQPKKTPTLVPIIQRHLSEVLLAHPVLMHPGLLCHTYGNSSRTFMALAHGIARSRYLGLPRQSHFAGADAQWQGLQLRERLTAFAKHPCVALGLGESLHVWLDPSTAQIRRAREPIAGLSKDTLRKTPMVEMLASIMELDDLKVFEGVDPADEALRSYVHGALPLAPKDGHPRADALRKACTAALQASFYASCGLDESFTDYSPADAQVDPTGGFLDALRRRSATAAGAGVELLTPGKTSLFVFGGRDELAEPALIRARVQRLCAGIVRARAPIGARADGAALYAEEPNGLAGAAAHVFEACLGPNRSGGFLPRVDAAGALVFFQAIDELGGIGEMSHGAGEVSAARATVLRTREELQAPRHYVAGRDVWLQALDAFWTSKHMSHVIDSIADAGPAREVAPVSAAATPRAAPRIAM